MGLLELFINKCNGKLLDTGKRNPLVNFRQPKNGSIIFETPGINAIWKDLVDGREISFPKSLWFDVDEEKKKEEFYTDENGRYTIKRTPSDANRVLKNLRQKAKTSIEEQGVNILYFAFGLIEWYESPTSDSPLHAPLILVPVTLTLESAMAPYVFKMADDDIVVNPTIRHLFLEQYDIDLPELGDQKLSEYFSEVRAAISNYPRWSLDEKVVCSVFSFLKLSMYEFLKKYMESIIQNPLVEAIAGETVDLPVFMSLNDDEDFDKKLEEHEVFQVIDADSSQQEAMLRAQEGVSFVLQGPPGTGKSQTITNIIAASIASGKKVLFVSEKSAALDVVYNKLQSANLGDFCLPLHSHKANKKEIINELARSLSLAGKKVTITDTATAKIKELQSDRVALNKYDEQLHKIIQPLGKSIYDVYGILAAEETAPKLSFVPDIDIREVSTETYFEFLRLVTELTNLSENATLSPVENPWYGAKDLRLTNEIRGDIKSHYESCVSKMKEISDFYSDTFGSLELDSVPTLNNIEELMKLSELSLKNHTVPECWLDEYDIEKKIDEDARYSVEFKKLRSELDKSVASVNFQFDPSEFSVEVTDLNTFSSILEELDRIVAFVKSDELFQLWRTTNPKTVNEAFELSKTNYTDYCACKRELEKNYIEDIYQVDYMAIGNRFANNYHAVIKHVNSQYKSDRESIIRCSKNFRKIKDAEIVDVVNKLKFIRQIESFHEERLETIHELFGETTLWSSEEISEMQKKRDQYQALFEYFEAVMKLRDSLQDKESSLEDNCDLYGEFYKGVDTDWDLLSDNYKWLLDFKSTLNHFSDEEMFIKNSCVNAYVITDSELEEIRNSYSELKADLEYFTNYFEDDYIEDIYDMPIGELISKYSKCCENMALLEEWLDYKTLLAGFKKCGIESFAENVYDAHIEPDDYMSAFKLRFFSLWLDSVLEEEKAVLKFRSAKQNETVRRFRADDEEILNISQRIVRGKLVNQLPDTNRQRSGEDQVAILRKEMLKQRKIMPIRILFARIPELLFALKPCLMMSPLSVSTYLCPECHQFDLVIFDEASQITTANAIGAISLGKQVIIAGDSKQLPPTNFFESSLDKSEYDNDDDDDWEVYDSLLDEANCFNELYLRWHYRSKNEDLIAFSNTTMYRNQLLTFPSNKCNNDNEGVSYIYLPDGVYDRGGRSGNPIEAQKVAEMVFEHFRAYPTRSLGVITFGSVQQNAIEDAIERMRIEDNSLEEFFREDREEPFFIKNLETVQGDERDTIIFSIGYAKDNMGVFRNNLGPLNKAGGERRLNVAVTRAKYNLKLVGSILPTDLNTDKSKSEGLRLLRKYIEYALNGPGVLNNEIKENADKETESPFEESVLNFLERKGYRVATQVGCSSYRIDLAIKHPTLSGIYVLGIECDGASYHSSRTARERDRLRQQILEKMGWSLYRIWSTDWIKDPKTEQAKLVDAVEKALSSYDENGNKIISDTVEEAENIETSQDEAIETNDDEYTIEESTLVSSNAFGFKEYQKTVFPKKYFFSRQEKMDLTMRYINEQFPVHIDQLYHDMLFLCGSSKVTSSVKESLNLVIRWLKEQNMVIQKGDFLYPSNYSEDDICVRINSGRKIDYFSDEELSKALVIVASKSFGITPNGLVTDTAVALSLSKSSGKTRSRLTELLDELIDDEVLLVNDGVIAMGENGLA